MDTKIVKFVNTIIGNFPGVSAKQAMIMYELVKQEGLIKGEEGMSEVQKAMREDMLRPTPGKYPTIMTGQLNLESIYTIQPLKSGLFHCTNSFIHDLNNHGKSGNKGFPKIKLNVFDFVQVEVTRGGAVYFTLVSVSKNKLLRVVRYSLKLTGNPAMYAILDGKEQK